MDFRSRYAAFLDELDAIAETHDELFDTEVRERLREVIDYHFGWDQPIGEDFPRVFAMFSDTADALVAAAVRSFIEEACALARAEGISTAAARHAAIEDDTLLGDEGGFGDYLVDTELTDAPVPPASDALYLSDARP